MLKTLHLSEGAASVRCVSCVSRQVKTRQIRDGFLTWREGTELSCLP
ncbi:MAG: hypothetical protein E6R04_09405 [Spirochaetes bacterium]|nr:MAG: hypothetical protein E6R04_09405 [Spirochaetota bacterium]